MSTSQDARNIESALGWKEQPRDPNDEWGYLIQTLMHIASLLAEALARIEDLETAGGQDATLQS